MVERKRLSRRQLLGASAGAGVLAALGLPTARAVAGQRGGVAVRTAEELVFVNGRIHAMDGNKRSAIDAMTYGLGLGVTTHLDQGAFQATNTPTDGAAHEDNYTMHAPFLAFARRRKAIDG